MTIPAIAQSPVNWVKIPLMAALGLVGIHLVLSKLKGA